MLACPNAMIGQVEADKYRLLFFEGTYDMEGDLELHILQYCEALLAIRIDGACIVCALTIQMVTLAEAP